MIAGFAGADASSRRRQVTARRTKAALNAIEAMADGRRRLAAFDGCAIIADTPSAVIPA